MHGCFHYGQQRLDEHSGFIQRHCFLSRTALELLLAFSGTLMISSYDLICHCIPFVASHPPTSNFDLRIVETVLDLSFIHFFSSTPFFLSVIISNSLLIMTVHSLILLRPSCIFAEALEGDWFYFEGNYGWMDVQHVFHCLGNCKSSFFSLLEKKHILVCLLFAGGFIL
jgi:hypothetical protein